MQRKFEANKILRDEFGRPSGVLLINKPKWITSHDVVDKARSTLGTKKVGHAGTLDPFATGLIIILVGKATKTSVDFLTLDKQYKAKILFGASTNTGDVEGEIQSISKRFNLKKSDIKKAIQSFQPEYIQYVPVFSSVKVQGKKLRKLARSSDRFEIRDSKPENGEEVKEVFFYDEQGKLKDKINLPKKKVHLDIKIDNVEKIAVSKLKQYFNDENFDNYSKLKEGKEFFVLNLVVDCSKGTYIRQLAIDIGKKLEIPSMLIELERTRIGEYKSKSAIEVESIR